MTRFRSLSLLAGMALASLTAGTAQAASPVVEQPVSFKVQNVNRTRLACPTDGKTYTIRGHLVGTPQQLRSGAAATLYLHGLGLGEFFWRFRDVPGYDFAANLAERGHVSVVIDRLGYRSSGKAPGRHSCIGGQADIAHQIIGQLKSGSYTAATDQTRGYAGQTAPTFRDVGLVGHSAGGLITQVEAYSFDDAKAIGVLAFADQGISAFQRTLAAQSARICAKGGVPAGGLVGTGPGGYALLGQTLPVGNNAFFSNADPFVINAALLKLTRNPCGDLASYGAAPATDKRELGRIRQPVLLIQGEDDTLFPPPAVQQQVARFTAAAAVTYREVPATGHALTLELSHGQTETYVADFLAANGL